MVHVRRRDFITLLGGAAVLWPLAARAQQPKIIRLGYLEPQRPTEAVAANLRRQFLLGLRDLGYVEGRHFKMEDRSANGQLDRLGNLASELARLPVDMFVAGGDAPILAAMQAKRHDPDRDDARRRSDPQRLHSEPGTSGGQRHGNECACFGYGGQAAGTA